MEKRRVQIKTLEDLEEELPNIDNIKGFVIEFFIESIDKRLPQDRIIETYYNEDLEEWVWEFNGRKKDIYFITEGMIKQQLN